MPISKVDREMRTVSGFASVDNIDEHNDIITASCAEDAFKRFRGNLREMHQQIAVGKVVDFDQRPVYDAESDKVYNGVHVTAYVSTGAQSTWEKVLDGTLTGFSIGGNLVDSEEVFDKEIGRPVRVVNKMNLYELSLVDNPANQLANVVSIQKANGKDTATGIAVDVETENVFWCDKSQISILSNDESLPLCPECDAEMENIGWIESTSEKAEKMKYVVNSHINKNFKEGGADNMADNDNTVEEAEVLEESTATEEVSEVVETESEADVEIENEAEEVVEATEEPANEEQSLEVTEIEQSVDEAVLEPAFDIDSFLENLVSSVERSISEALSGVSKSLESTLNETREVLETAKAVQKDLSGFNSQISDVQKQVKVLVDETAVKKSGELSREPDKTKKGLWSGKFLNSDEL